jgi:hypothetical protein
VTQVFERADPGMSGRCDGLLRAGLPRAHMALYIPASLTVQAGNRTGGLTAPTLPHTHDPHVEEIPTLADGRNRLPPAQTQPAQHCTTMPQQASATPAHRTDRPTRALDGPASRARQDQCDPTDADSVHNQSKRWASGSTLRVISSHDRSPCGQIGELARRAGPPIDPCAGSHPGGP